MHATDDSAPQILDRIAVALWRRRWLSLAVLLGLIVFAWAGVPAIFILLSLHDERAKVAQAILFDRGRAADGVTNAALRARFPDGTPRIELEALVSKLHGRCNGDKTLSCSIPMDGVICLAEELDIQAEITRDGTLSQIKAAIVQNAC